MTDTAELKPVAWRVKDYADGWIFYTDEKRARIEAEIMSGALVEPLYSADALSSLVRERDEALKVLRDHHKWHAESGVLGIPDGDGGWIEMDNGAEYADSRLCQRTEEALRDMPAEFVVPPRGGWAMGSNHWENWQLAYRQKRAAEARATAAEADAARMQEALEPSAATKAAYIGEFTIAVERIVNEDEEPVDDGADAPDPYDHIQVPWTTIKQIMAAIRAFALPTPKEPS